MTLSLHKKLSFPLRISSFFVQCMMVDKAKIVTKGKTLAKNFNNYFINIVGKCGKTKPIVLVVKYNNLGNIAKNA